MKYLGDYLLQTAPSGPIPPIECSERDGKALAELIDHIEEYPTDPDRVRFVFKSGAKGKWFSRRWDKLTILDVT